MSWVVKYFPQTIKGCRQHAQLPLHSPLALTDKPGAPGQPDVTDITATIAAIAWTAPENDGGTPITNYVIEYKKTTDVGWQKANPDTTVAELTFSVEGLTEETDYVFRVAAENKAGIGPFSPPSEPRKYGKLQRASGHICSS